MSTTSAIWKIGLFTKLSASEAQCGSCGKIIQMADYSTKGLFKHAKTHEEYAAKLKEIAEKEASEKNSMDQFVKILPKGLFLSLWFLEFAYHFLQGNSHRWIRRFCI
jgi:hypothetical protein